MKLPWMIRDQSLISPPLLRWLQTPLLINVSGFQMRGQLCSWPLLLMKSRLDWLLSTHHFGLSSRTHSCEGQRVCKSNHPVFRRTFSPFCGKKISFFLDLSGQKCLGNTALRKITRTLHFFSSEIIIEDDLVYEMILFSFAIFEVWKHCIFFDHLSLSAKKIFLMTIFFFGIWKKYCQ